VFQGLAFARENRYAHFLGCFDGHGCPGQETWNGKGKVEMRALIAALLLGMSAMFVGCQPAEDGGDAPATEEAAPAEEGSEG
jgi:hypothetical protein